MLKHVQVSPLRNRSDSVSLRSSTSCTSSICGSPEPLNDLRRTPSRASSYSSLNESLPQTTIKVFTNCLKIDIEYKTLGIQWDTTSKEVIAQLLRRLKMHHRDPKLFYLSMEVTVRRAEVKTVLVLDDEARPAILQACHPKGDSRFCLQLKPGGLIRVHTSALQSSSQYKSLVISQETTSDELLSILLTCYNSFEVVEQFSLYEVCPGQEYQRKLHPDDKPLKAQNERIQRGERCHFLVRRNPNYSKRFQILSPLSTEAKEFEIIEHIQRNNKTFKTNKSLLCNDDNNNNESFTTNKINTKVIDSNVAALSDIVQQKREMKSQLFLSKKDIQLSSCCQSKNTTNLNENKDEKDFIRRNTISTLNIPPTTSLQSLSSSTIFLSTLGSEYKELNLTNFQQNENNEEFMEINSIKLNELNLKTNYKNEQSKKENYKVCSKCQNNFESCEFCDNNSSAKILDYSPNSSLLSISSTLSNNSGFSQQLENEKHKLKNFRIDSYNPVYNIREIRTVNHSFSALGNDKKILDINLRAHLIPLTTTATTTDSIKEKHDFESTKTTFKDAIDTKNINKKIANDMINNKNSLSILTIMPFSIKSQKICNSLLSKSNNCKKDENELKDIKSAFESNVNKESTSVLQTNLNIGKISNNYLRSHKTRFVQPELNMSKPIEEVNNNPAKGLGHFVYI